MFPFPAVHFAQIPWDYYLILIFLGTFVPWRGAVRMKRLLGLPAISAKERLSLYRSTTLYQWLLVTAVAWRASSGRLKLGELGLAAPDPWKVTSVAAVLTALLSVIQWASLRRMAILPEADRGLLFRIAEKIAPRTFWESIAFAVLSCTAGFSEEFLYRGFLFAVLIRMYSGLASSVAIAAIASSAWFGIGHLYQGRRGIITTFIVGLIFCALRIWTGSLIPSIAAHAGIDLVAGFGFSRAFQSSAM